VIPCPACNARGPRKYEGRVGNDDYSIVFWQCGYCRTVFGLLDVSGNGHVPCSAPVPPEENA